LTLVFFHESVSPGFSLIDGVVDTGDKFITGGVNDTGEQLLPVTTTPAINVLPVTRTRAPWRWGAAKDRRKSAISPALDAGHGR
jgi:hypothetical protein